MEEKPDEIQTLNIKHIFGKKGRTDMFSVFSFECSFVMENNECLFYIISTDSFSSNAYTKLSIERLFCDKIK